MKALLCLASAVLAISMASCGGKKQTETSGAPAGELLTAHARLLRMERTPQYIKVDIANPWDTAAAPLGRYVLVERGVVPDSLPEGYRRLDVPLQRSLVYSSVHTGALAEMGASDAVAAVADGRYFTGEPMRSRIASGAVADVGSSTSPSVEKIVAIGPDAVLLSPFENAGHGALDNLGIPLVECADYMEPTPLARAEWIKLLGALYGRLPQADSIYSAVERDYKALAARAAEAQSHPLVLTEKLTSGYWFVPGGASYMARMIEDAGGRYPWEGNTSAGSLQLDFSAVYARAADADVWLICATNTFSTRSSGLSRAVEYTWPIRPKYLCSTSFRSTPSVFSPSTPQFSILRPISALFDIIERFTEPQSLCGIHDCQPL